jgi:hypothetical protein
VTRLPSETNGAGLLRDAFGRRELTVRNLNDPLDVGDVPGVGTVFDADGREQVVITGWSGSALSVNAVNAKTDGVTDNLAILNAAAAQAVARGISVLELPVGDIAITSGQFVLPAGVRLRGQGPKATRIIQRYWGTTLIRSAGTLATGIALTADATSRGFQISVPTAGIAVGDYLLLGSEAPAFGTDAAANGKKAEIVRVKSIDSASLLSVWGMIRDNYLVASTASVQKMSLNQAVGLEDLTVVNPEPTLHTTSFVDFTLCQRPRISGVEFEGCDSTALILTNCYSPFVDNCSFRDQPDRVGGSPALFGYGIALNQSTENAKVSSCHFQRVRHGVTTLTAGGQRGVARNCLIEGCTASECTAPPFDTHPGCEDITFSGCIAEYCTHAGFQLRGQSDRVLGGAVSWCANGVWVGSDAYGSEIRGVSIRHIGGAYTGTGDIGAPSLAGGGYGISYIGGSDPTKSGQEFKVFDCTFEDLLRAGVFFGGGSVNRGQISRCSIINPGQQGATMYGVYFDTTVTDIANVRITNNEIYTYGTAGLERNSNGQIDDAIRVDSAAVTSLYVTDNDLFGVGFGLVGGARAASANIVKWRNRFNNVLATPSVHAYHNAAQATASGTALDLNFNSNRYDTEAMQSGGTFTVKTPGLWRFGVDLQWAFNATGRREVKIVRGASQRLASASIPAVATASNPTFLHVSGEHRLAAGDTVKVTVTQDSGGALNVNASDTTNALDSCEFWMSWVGE